MNKYLVSYNTPLHRNLLIVIWADDKTKARGILKRHLGNTTFTINRITKEDVK